MLHSPGFRMRRETEPPLVTEDLDNLGVSWRLPTSWCGYAGAGIWASILPLLLTFVGSDGARERARARPCGARVLNPSSQQPAALPASLSRSPPPGLRFPRALSSPITPVEGGRGVIPEVMNRCLFKVSSSMPADTRHYSDLRLPLAFLAAGETAQEGSPGQERGSAEGAFLSWCKVCPPAWNALGNVCKNGQWCFTNYPKIF